MGYKDPVQREMEELAKLEELMKAQQANGEETGEESDNGDTGNEDTGTDDTPPPATEESAPATPPAAPQEQQKPDVWQQRFYTLQGKYNAEIPRLQSQIAALTSETEQLRAAQAPATDATGEGEYRSPHLTNEVRQSQAYRRMAEEYGTEYAELHSETAALAARAAARSEIQPVEARMAETTKDRYHREITAIAPNWTILNDDPAFIEAMNSKHVYGRSLREHLQAAYENGDAHAVAEFFNEYERSRQQPAGNVSQPNAEQSSLIAPPRRGSAAQVTIDNNKAKVWSMSEVDEFYRDLEHGVKYKGKEKEAALIEGEIMKALNEGRIV